jgi:hypothetical protein
MAAAIPTSEPLEIISGATVKWTKSLSDYPADTWTLSYQFVNAADAQAVTCTASGLDHLATITAAQTAAMVAGDWYWQAKVTDGDEVYAVGQGRVEVKANFAVAGASSLDARSHVKKVLDALEAVLVGKASEDQLSMSIGDRSLSRYSFDELRKMRSAYKSEYAREQRQERIAAGLGHGGKVRIRFTN